MCVVSVLKLEHRIEGYIALYDYKSYLYSKKIIGITLYNFTSNQLLNDMSDSIFFKKNSFFFK